MINSPQSSKLKAFFIAAVLAFGLGVIMVSEKVGLFQTNPLSRLFSSFGENATVERPEFISEAKTKLPSSAQEIIRKHAFDVVARTQGGKKLNRRTVILTAASIHMHPFIHNLHCYVSRSSKQQVVLFAMDHNVSTLARKQGIPTIEWKFLMNQTESLSGYNETGPILFGSGGFSKMSMLKFEIVRQVLHMGVDVIFSDVDVIWCTDIPQRFGELLSERGNVGLHFDGLMQSNFQGVEATGELNTGFYYIKANDRVLQLYDEFCDEYLENPYRDDQFMFFNFACGGGRVLSPGDGMYRGEEKQRGNERGGKAPRVHCEWKDGSVRIMMLPVREFPNGSSDDKGRPMNGLPEGYYRERCEVRRRDLAAWHVNFLFSDRKEETMKRQDVWISANGICRQISPWT